MNEREFEDALGQWRAGEVPGAIKIDKARAPKGRMLLPAIGATAVFVSAVIATTFLPGRTLARGAISVAEMVQAGKKVRYYSTTYSRFMSKEKGGGFQFCSQVAPTGSYVQVKHFGGREKFDSYSYLEDSQLVEVEPAAGYAVVSTYQQFKEMSGARPESFGFEKWLYDKKKTKVSAHVLWRGIDCTRYQYHEWRGKVEVLQEIYVDNKTRLPLFHLNSRPSEGWRDETEFDYATPSVPKAYRTLPQGLRIYNTSELRERVRAVGKHSSSDVALILYSEYGQVAILLRKPLEKCNAFLRKGTATPESSPQFKEMRSSEYKGCLVFGEDQYYVLETDEPGRTKTKIEPGSVESLTGQTLVNQHGETYFLPIRQIPVVFVPELSSFLEPLYGEYWKRENLRRAKVNKKRR